jgi:hypothetical protein
MATGAASVLAGAMDIILMAALFFVAFIQIASHGFCATGKYICEGSFVAWEHLVAKLVQILSAVGGHNIG